MRNEIGTQKAFEDYMLKQAALYQTILTNHFGLPDPEKAKRHQFVAVMSPLQELNVTGDELSHSVTINQILFRLERFHMFGNEIKVWVRE